MCDASQIWLNLRDLPEQLVGSGDCHERVDSQQVVVYRSDLCAVPAPDESSGGDGCV